MTKIGIGDDVEYPAAFLLQNARASVVFQSWTVKAHVTKA